MLRLLLSLLLILASCGKTSISKGDTSNACAAGDTKNGLICLLGQWQPKLAGMCASSADCPVPYNYCDSSNRCQVQLAQSGSKQIWFATDAIRPGVASDCNNGSCLNQNGYIYNIMAKGYESLDDWCLSQAQQSTMTNMRNIRSWTALIIAQPDNSNVEIGQLSSFGLARSRYYFAPNTLVDPSKTHVFGYQSNTICDKNDVLKMSGADGNSIWSGLYYAGGICQTINSSNCVGVSPSMCCAYFGDGNDSGNCDGCDNGANLSQMQPNQSNTVVFIDGAGNGSNSWSSFQSGSHSGLMVLSPTSCSGQQGDWNLQPFVAGGLGYVWNTDCDNNATFNANDGQQKPILCLANQSSS